MFAFLVCLQSTLTVDPFLTVHQVARAGNLFRTTTVLLEELSYRSRDTPRTREFFKTVYECFPETISEPHYTYGYLWPHAMEKLVASPEDARLKKVHDAMGTTSMAVEFMPLWSVLHTDSRCLESLKLKKLGRVLEASQTTYSVTTVPARSSIVNDVLQLADMLSSPRLIAALICDLSDARDLPSLQAVLRSEQFEIVKLDRVPPGCDTHDIAWKAFRDAIHGGPSIEFTFADLLDRAIALSKPDSHDRQPRAQAFRHLEKELGEGVFSEMPFREVFDSACVIADVENGVDWPELARFGIDPDRPITIKWADGVLCRVFIQRATFMAYGAKARVCVTGDGKVTLEPTAVGTGN